ncbi:MAG: hypothetical protein ACTJIA_12755, partial [Halomonas sp.]
MDRVYAFPKETKHFHCFSSDKDIKQHSDYRAAKSGDAGAALQLVDDLALEFLISLKNEIPEGSVFVSPYAKEAGKTHEKPRYDGFCSALPV